MDQEKRYLTIPEAAELLGISVHTLRARVSPGSKTPLRINGRLFKPFRVNRSIRFDREELEKEISLN